MSDRELGAMQAALAALEPLSGDERERVLSWLGDRLGLQPGGSRVQGSAGGQGHTGGGGGTVKQFAKEKQPQDDKARALTLAYFLTHFAGQATFKTSDLSQARVDAAMANFNVSRAVDNARQTGYLTSAGQRGVYQITSVGEAIVEAMPDAARVQEAKSQVPNRKRRPATKKRGVSKAAAKRA